MKNPFSYIVQRWFPRIAAINHKYRTPRVALTPPVRYALLALRIYLLLLILLLIYKFVLSI